MGVMKDNFVFDHIFHFSEAMYRAAKSQKLLAKADGAGILSYCGWPTKNREQKIS